MLTVITQATATNLTTLARARALLSFAAADDAAVAILIGQASAAIVDHCRRPFGIETVRETFDCGTHRDGAFLLSRSPVTDIASVVEAGATLDAAEWQFDPETGRIYRVTSDGDRLWMTWSAGLVVTYTAGYVLPSDATGAPAPTLPPPVERAAIRLVGSYLSIRGRDSLIKSETVEGVGSTSWWIPGTDGNLPDPEAEQLLAPYMRMF